MYLLPESNPENVIEAPVGSIFTRFGDQFYLISGGRRSRLNIPKKSFGLSQNPLIFENIDEEIIGFETPGETWRKSSGNGKTGWSFSTNKTSVAVPTQPSIITIMGDIESVAAGAYFSYFLKTNGELWAAGENYDGALGLGFTSLRETASLSLTDVKKAFSGIYNWNTGFAIKNDNTLWGTGYGGDGQFGNGTTDTYNVWTQIILDGDITGSGYVVDIKCGEYFTAFLMSDNSLWAAGDDLSLPSYTPQLISTDVKDFAAGGYHLLYVNNNGTLFGVGENGDGQLGTGDYTYHNYDDPVQIDTNVKTVGAGGYHSGYIKNDDTLWMMGANWDYQLGTGDDNERTVPVQVSTNVKYITGGDSHTVFVKNDNTLYGMGANYSGQLSIPSLTLDDVFVPTLIDSGVSKVVAGYEHTLYVKTDKMLYGMGYNGYYALGYSFNIATLYSTNSSEWTDSGVTTPINNDDLINTSIYDGTKFIAGGGDSNTFIKYSTDGKIWNTASLNSSGNQIFGMEYNGSDKYVATTGATPEIYISSDGINWNTQSLENHIEVGDVTYGNGKFIIGGTNGVAIKMQHSSDGTNWTQSSVPFISGTNNSLSYGNGIYVSANFYGGDSSNKNNYSQSFYGYTASYLSANSYIDDSCVIVKDGILYRAGKSLPLFASAGVYDVKNATCVFNAMLFVKNDNTLWGMGQNMDYCITGSKNYGTLKTPVQIDTNVSESYANHYGIVFYIKNDNTLWARGQGISNITGTTWNPVSGSIQVDTDVKYAAVGDEYVLYIKNDNTLWGRGNNIHGQLGTGDTNYRTSSVQIDTNVFQCATGQVTSIYVKNDGSVYGMGYNFFGQLGLGDNSGRNTPTMITSSGVINVGCNLFGCHYVTSDGKLYAAGQNDIGQLGLGNFTNYNTFQLVDITDVKIVKGGSKFTFIQKTDNTIYSTGTDSFGQLGTGKTANSGLYSSDGASWSSSYATLVQMIDSIYANGRFVMVGDYNTALSSTDGINWTASYFHTTGSIYNQTINISSITHDGSQFIAAGYSNDSLYDIFKSPDGVNWSSHASGKRIQWGSISYGDGKYVLLARQLSEYVLLQEKITIE